MWCTRASRFWGDNSYMISFLNSDIFISVSDISVGTVSLKISWYFPFTDIFDLTSIHNKLWICVSGCIKHKGHVLLRYPFFIFSLNLADLVLYLNKFLASATEIFGSLKYFCSFILMFGLLFFRMFRHENNVSDPAKLPPSSRQGMSSKNWNQN